MAIKTAFLSAVYDDSTQVLTVTAMLEPPPRPPEIPADRWYPGEGLKFEFDVRVRSKDGLPANGVYAVEGTDPVRMFRIEHDGTRWKMPGTKISG